MIDRARKTVLIVDDTPANIAVMAGLLKDHYATKVATNGEKALAIADSEDKPDLILLDVVMPGLDGYEVCRRLKAAPATRDIPVIFLTARTEAEDEKKGFECGAVDYIHKPFSPPLVMARVETQLALRRALLQAQRAQKQADDLLHCLLPEFAAEEIRTIGTVIPRRHENVAVLFCDIVSFTAYCDRHPPEDVVARLDAVFVIFEQVAARHGLEKIKTIGDAFMAAANLLKETPDGLDAAIRCGLEMTAKLAASDLGWEARVGVHYGPVVAGIVGQERYQFDIWGDTVNVAARMAGKAQPGGVAVTESVWERIRNRFSGRSLGLLAVSGKGEVGVFEITGQAGVG
jgi:class 3 adenylate cyclase